jgi:hypothetical protein
MEPAIRIVEDKPLVTTADRIVKFCGQWQSRPIQEWPAEGSARRFDGRNRAGRRSFNRADSSPKPGGRAMCRQSTLGRNPGGRHQRNSTRQTTIMSTREHRRLAEVTNDVDGWRRWGPYVSDRSWGTVREDYSSNGDAWNHLPHDLARSKAYRWGEDGIAGLCDRYQLLVFAPAFWNGCDPILKERFFGLNSNEGNHGEDVKEYYFHLDNTPTHSYMALLYKYPQAPFPYSRLVEESRRRDSYAPEFELLDTGVFDENRYFDVLIEYAKLDPEDICIRLSAANRGPRPACLHLVPQLWFRNNWAWDGVPRAEPIIRRGPAAHDSISLLVDDSACEPLRGTRRPYRLGSRMLYAQPGASALFTFNETNGPRVYGPGSVSRTQYVKDGIDRAIVQGEQSTNPQACGTKAALHYVFPAIEPGQTASVLLRLSDQSGLAAPLADVPRVFDERKAEADEYYESLHPAQATPDERRIQRQAWAGLLWSKQFYMFDVALWQDGDDPKCPPPASRRRVRNAHWRHLNSMRVMTLPDKWEYPWFAAWDLAFQCVAMAVVDPDYAKGQLGDLLFEQFIHPNGQLPAYEWEFSDLNPPVHAWAVWRVYNMARIRTGHADRAFLARCFHKLLLNFTWWINKVDRAGNNVFEGGFLGLDNIAVFDRSEPFCDGSVLEQSDATGWMGMFCLNMMRIALELAKEDPVYEALAVKFFQHYTLIAAAMKHMGGRQYQLWDEQDGFFYDVLRSPDGRFRKLKIRSLVGLIPLFAVERLEMSWIEQFSEFRGCLDWYLENRRAAVQEVVHTVERDGQTTHVLTIVNQQQLERILRRVWQPGEFLAQHGLRSLSKAHQDDPFVLDGCAVRYEPGEATVRIKGGNSNWRGPIWLPICFLLIESLRKLGKAFGPDWKIPLSDQPGGKMALLDMGEDLANRLISLFTADANGRRPVFGDAHLFQTDPHWRNLLLFYEYFHGDTGAGLGASHQTGWTALAASLIDEWRQPAAESDIKPESPDATRHAAPA